MPNTLSCQQPNTPLSDNHGDIPPPPSTLLRTPQVSTTGALGLRTKHQVDPKAQLVAVVSSSHHPQSQQQQEAPSSSTSTPTAAAAGGVLTCAAGLDQDLSQLHIADVALTQELQGMEDDSAVLPTPQLLDPPAAGSSSSSGGGASPAQGANRPLSGLEQALLLGWAGQVRKGTAQDKLQAWEMAPYVEAVLLQQRTQYALQVGGRDSAEGGARAPGTAGWSLGGWSNHQTLTLQLCLLTHLHNAAMVYLLLHQCIQAPSLTYHMPSPLHAPALNAPFLLSTPCLFPRPAPGCSRHATSGSAPGHASAPSCSWSSCAVPCPHSNRLPCCAAPTCLPWASRCGCCCARSWRRHTSPWALWVSVGCAWGQQRGLCLG
jgi:hypothetical protein